MVSFLDEQVVLCFIASINNGPRLSSPCYDFLFKLTAQFTKINFQSSSQILVTRLKMDAEEQKSNKSDGDNTSKSVVDKFFSSLKELSKKLDSDVLLLESKVKSQVSKAVTSKDGEFAAPIADDINDDLTNLNRYEHDIQNFDSVIFY